MRTASDWVCCKLNENNKCAAQMKLCLSQTEASIVLYFPNYRNIVWHTPEPPFEANGATVSGVILKCNTF